MIVPTIKREGAKLIAMTGNPGAYIRTLFDVEGIQFNPIHETTKLADDLTLFIRNDEGLYEKYEETHYQRAYALETVCQLIRQAGMKLEAVYDAFTFEKPRPDSERVYIVAREQGK